MTEQREKHSLIQELKHFIMQGNVIDMTIGVTVATAFGKVTTALIGDVIMPIATWATDSHDFDSLMGIVHSGVSSFVGALINFAVIALVAFVVIKVLSKAKSIGDHAAEIERQGSDSEVEVLSKLPTQQLLAEILVELRKSNHTEETIAPLCSEEIEKEPFYK